MPASTQKPWVLSPEGPFSWASYWHISAQVQEVLGRVPAEIARIPIYEKPPASLLLGLKSASCWVLPPGSFGQGALGYVEKLAGTLGGRPPLVLMTNAEAAKGFLHLTGYSRAIRHDDLILTTCSAERRLIREAFPLAMNIETLAIPVAPKFFEPLSKRQCKDFRASLGMSQSDPFFVYAGRLSYQKNLHVIIDAFVRVLSENPRAKLHLLGDVDQLGFPHFGLPPKTSYAQFLTWRASRLGISHAIRFHGPVGQDRLRLFFGACDVQVSATVHFGEDFGYSIAQGMAAGVPTVVTCWGGGADFVHEGAALGINVTLAKTGPRASLSSASGALCEMLDPRERRMWKERAQEYAARELHPSAQVKRWRALLKSWQNTKPLATPLKPSRETQRFYDRQALLWNDKTDNLKLFEGPSDPAYRKTCSEYLSLKRV